VNQSTRLEPITSTGFILATHFFQRFAFETRTREPSNYPAACHQPSWACSQSLLEYDSPLEVLNYIMTMEDTDFRRKRKEDAKLKKRQRIEESGGVRPRAAKTPKQNEGESVGLEKSHVEKSTEHAAPRNFERKPPVSKPRSTPSLTGHRFGRVMEKTPCRNKPRFSTVSIALPGSVLSNCQTRELLTLLVGQIARAATIYHVDEVIVFDDKLGKTNHRSGGWRRNLIRDNRKHDSKEGEEETKKEIKEEPKEETNDKVDGEVEEPQQERRPRSTPQEFMARLLQYCECPQYLRRHFFPMHPDLQFAGLLAPIDAPHHVREGDASKYREGVVLQKKSPKGGSLVNCGIRNRPVAYVQPPHGMYIGGKDLGLTICFCLLAELIAKLHQVFDAL
jgi:predicted SPOUT superfamily RNA methylase MTH1